MSSIIGNTDQVTHTTSTDSNSGGESGSHNTK